MIPFSEFFPKNHIVMSTPDTETIIKTAKLAQLELSSEQVALIARELGGIFPLFEALDRDDIHALVPLGHPLGGTQPLREDSAQNDGPHFAIETNAPLAEDGFITVPKVIG